MKVTIHPGTARGRVTAPPSKSMAHRLLIGAGLSEGISRISNVAMSQDILATLDCLKALGATYEVEGDTVTVTGISLLAEKKREEQDQVQELAAILPCRECGSTLRFMIPLCLLTGKTYSLTGSDRLMERPLTIYEELCRERGFFYQKEGNTLQVGGQLSSGTYEVAGDISSQFITGLLYALSLLQEDSRICLLPPVESRPYIDMTIQALALFGVQIRWVSETELLIPGGQKARAADCRVEGDYSNAAFLEALNLCGGNVQVDGLGESLQGDQIYREYFARLQEGPAELDLTDCPDLGPILFTAAALLHGARFTGTRRLRIKESDRAVCMQQELAKMGISMDVQENTVEVRNTDLHRPEEMLFGHNDHRIVMALAVAAVRTGAVIDGAQAITKSFPDFFQKLESLGLEVETDGMDQ